MEKKKKGRIIKKSIIIEKWNPLYIKMGAIFLSASVAALFVFWMDNTQSFPHDESGASMLSRNGHGEGEREEELEVIIGDMKESMIITIQEQEYTRQQFEQVIQNSGESLQALVLGENKSLDEVRRKLNLVSEIPNTGIRVSWELDNYEVMNLQGELRTENLNDNGTLVRLTAILSYREEKAEVSFYACVYPPLLNQSEKLLKKINEEIDRLDEETKEEKNLLLPMSVDGIPIIWKHGRNFRAAGLMLLGIILTLFIYVSEQEKKKQQKKIRSMQLALDYPQMVSKFTLYLGAGMTVRKTWYRICEDYEGQKEVKGRREVYEEMIYTMHEIQGGSSEGECYENFGERCGLPVYKKFSAMLSQNLKKGTKGLTSLLNQESNNAFEERKSFAKQLGEEAGTKMMIPMFLMLAVVLVIIVVPAFFSIQI
ncbi:MAG: secretion protein F [Ruminococcus sp.]|nr:secretion protein F [Ruminococcus sp.]